MWNEKAGGAEFDSEFEAFMNDMGGGAPKVNTVALIVTNNRGAPRSKKWRKTSLMCRRWGILQVGFLEEEAQSQG